ncbi:Uncharacterized protein Adt_41886 [Abeliophyllum distichum]|uniref:Uncharacterized protein n=1 Tax=Abeliophyllum distichum TaxID=126358 RepID=A0ABD1PQ45_9LAMI
MSINSGFDKLSRAIVVMSSNEVSLELAEVLPIRGIVTCMGEEIHIAGYDKLGLIGGGPGATSSEFVNRLAAEDISSSVNEMNLDSLRQTFKVPANIRFYVPEPHERSCAHREGFVSLHVQSFNARTRLPLDPFYGCVLKTYGLALTQVATNGWSQMVGSLYLWFWHSTGFEMPLHVF